MTINELILIFYLRRTDNYVQADRPQRETSELRHGIQGTDSLVQGDCEDRR